MTYTKQDLPIITYHDWAQYTTLARQIDWPQLRTTLRNLGPLVALERATTAIQTCQFNSSKFSPLTIRLQKPPTSLSAHFSINNAEPVAHINTVQRHQIYPPFAQHNATSASPKNETESAASTTTFTPSRQEKSHSGQHYEEPAENSHHPSQHFVTKLATSSPLHPGKQSSSPTHTINE